MLRQHGPAPTLTYPTGDPVTWAEEHHLFPADCRGTRHAVGTWRGRSTEGRLRISTYYDALWRPC